jgi:hypothetical protein
MTDRCQNPPSISRTVAYSRAEQVHIILPVDCNPGSAFSAAS